MAASPRIKSAKCGFNDVFTAVKFDFESN
jgi:hypothetical protein